MARSPPRRTPRPSSASCGCANAAAEQVLAAAGWAAARREIPRMALATTSTPVFEGHVMDFLSYLEFERGLSRNTLEAYRSDLLQLGAYLNRTGSEGNGAGHAELAGLPDELGPRSGDP